jgi:hypothetical protein
VSLFRDFFFHLNMVARFEQLELGAYDVVLCTQPASWAVRHPKKVVLFYHHTRTFYDLFEAIESVRGHDVALHHLAAFIVRDVDGFFLTPDVPILAGSRRVKQRLSDLMPTCTCSCRSISVFDYTGPVSFEAPCASAGTSSQNAPSCFFAMLRVRAARTRAGYGSFTDGWPRWTGGSGCSMPRRLRHCAVHVDDDRLWRAIHFPLADLRRGTTAEARGGSAA